MSKPLISCKFGARCRSLRSGQYCPYDHSASNTIPCKFGARCRSFRGGECKYDHTPSPKQLEILKMISFMKEQAKLHAHKTQIPCAIQYSWHSYHPENKTKTVYTTIDGTVVFRDGYPISENLQFANAHYGPLGASNRGLDTLRIVETVRKMYYDWYVQHTMSEDILEKLGEMPIDGLFKRPDSLIASLSYCGN